MRSASARGPGARAGYTGPAFTPPAPACHATRPAAPQLGPTPSALAPSFSFHIPTDRLLFCFSFLAFDHGLKAAVMAMVAAARKAQVTKIEESLSSWLQSVHCTVSSSPASGPKVNYWRVTYKCPGCNVKHQPKGYWTKTSTQESVAFDIAEKIHAVHGSCNTAPPTKSGEFIAVQDREDGNHTIPFMIGVTLDTGDGTCFAVPKKGRQNVNRTRFDDGEYGIAVQWLGRLAEDSELRTFDLAADCAEEFIVNSTELRCSQIEMIPVQALGPTVRRSRRSRGGGGGHHAAKVAGQRPGQYTLPVETEQLILRTCW